MAKHKYIILDVDSTILSPRARILTLFRIWIQAESLIPYSIVAKVLDSLDRVQAVRGFEDLFKLLESLLLRHFTTEELLKLEKKSVEYWYSNYWTPESLALDSPLAGACDLIKKLSKDYQFFVVSGRTDFNMADTTLMQLNQYLGANFFLADQLFFRGEGQDHRVFKREQICSLAKRFSIHAIFDDDLDVLLDLKSGLPKVQKFWVCVNVPNPPTIIANDIHPIFSYAKFDSNLVQ